MRNLEKIFGSERFETISKLAINPLEVTIFNSIIFKKDENDNEPIYLTHLNLPSIEDDESEIDPGFVYNSKENTEDDYVTGDYFWNPIKYTDIIFSNLNPTDILGDIILITEKEVFELTNVSLDGDYLFYDYAELKNE